MEWMQEDGPGMLALREPPVLLICWCPGPAGSTSPRCLSGAGSPAHPRPAGQNLHFSPIPRHLVCTFDKLPYPTTWARGCVGRSCLKEDGITGSGCVSTKGSQADTELGTCETNPVAKATSGTRHCGDSPQQAGLAACQNLPIPTLCH